MMSSVAWRWASGGCARTLTDGLEHGRALRVLVEAARAGEAHIDGLRHPRRRVRVPSKDGRVEGKRQPVVRHSERRENSRLLPGWIQVKAPTAPVALAHKSLASRLPTISRQPLGVYILFCCRGRGAPPT